MGCFVIVGTIYEAEFSKRPWKGGFTSPSCVRTAQIRVTVQPSSHPFQQLTTPCCCPLAKNLVRIGFVCTFCRGKRRNLGRSFNDPPREKRLDLFLYRASDESDPEKKRRRGERTDCIEACTEGCIVTALDSSNGTKGSRGRLTGRVRYQAFANRCSNRERREPSFSIL